MPLSAPERLKGISAYGMLLLATVAWGTNPPVLKLLVTRFDPIAIGFLRFALALPLIAGVVLVSRSSRASLRMTPRELGSLLFLGIIGLALFVVAQQVGLRFTTATNNALLVNASPLLAYPLSWLLTGELLTRSGLLGLGAGFLGVYLVIGYSQVSLVGDLLSLTAGLTWAIYTVAGTRIIARRDPLAVTFYAFLFGTPMLAAIALPGGPLPTLEASDWLILLYVAVVPAAIGYSAWYKALETIPPARASSFQFISPLVAAIIATLALHELPTWSTIVGGALILTSLATVNRPHPT